MINFIEVYKVNNKLKEILLCIIFVFALVVVVPMTINMLYMCETPIFITVWDGTDLLNFYGILLGAGATIFAVLATINHNSTIIEKQSFYDASKIMIPFFKIDNIDCSVTYKDNESIIHNEKKTLSYSDNTWDTDYEYDSNEYNIIDYRIKVQLKNIGEGLAIYTSDDELENLNLGNAETIEKNDIYTAVFVGQFEVNDKAIFLPKHFYHSIFYTNIRGIMFEQELTVSFQRPVIQLLQLEVLTLSTQEIISESPEK